MDQNIQIPEQVRGFLEALLADAQINMVDDQMKEDMIKELYERLDRYLTSVIVDNLKPQDLEEFIKLNEAKRPKEEVEQFLRGKVDDPEGMFAKAFADFRDMYLGKVEEGRDQQNQTAQDASQALPDTVGSHNSN